MLEESTIIRQSFRILQKSSNLLNKKKALSFLLLLTFSLTACSTISFEDTKATAKIIRHICPPVIALSKKQQDDLETTLAFCTSPAPNKDPIVKDLCQKYIFALSQWEVMRAQSRICFNQK